MSYVSTNQLVDFTPLNGLSPDNLTEIASKTEIESCKAGRYIFKKGDADNTNVYLLEGEVEILDDKTVIKAIKATAESAANPIAQGQPRAYSLRATSDCSYIRVDSNLLDLVMTWSQSSSYHVEEINDDDDDDWMTQILQAKAFHRVPPANIQAIFMKMEMVEHKPGDVIIKQGDEGDFFYIIKSGRALVTRPSPANPKGAKLAELNPGDNFGEEALLSDSKRNATITMLTKGQLVRLAKDDFMSLLNEPTLDKVDYKKAKESIADGKSILLDVRLPQEHAVSHIQNSENLPFMFMRMKMKTLDTSKQYILYCDTERRSSAAAFILNENNIQAVILSNGINGAPESDKISS